MSFFQKLERFLRPIALPNLTLGLIVGQVLVFLTAHARPDLIGSIALVPQKVLEGEVWRLVTFLFIAPIGNVIFAAFFWYLFYLMGSSLEVFWGIVRYNLYLLIGLIATVAVSFLTPEEPASNGFLGGSVFLAFAFLNPDFEIYLFFLVPIRIKWLALLTWISFGVAMVIGHGSTRLQVSASVCNFLLFFAPEIWWRVRSARRRMALRARQFATPEKLYYHRCLVCGITDQTHPKMEFRYCSKCAGACGYCTDHLRDHEHVTTAEGAPS
jgi:hypothetical protein